MRQGFVLACQCRGGDLGYHEARVHAAVAHQEWRQLGHVLIHHQRDSTLRQRPDFGNRQGDIICGHRHRLGVEVTARNHLVFLSKYQWVIGHRIGFDQQHFCRLAQLRQACAHHLRLAAQGIRILHLLTVVMRIGNVAGIGKYVAVHGSGINLPALAAHLVDAGIERTTRAEHRLSGQCTAHHRRGEQIFRFKQTAQRESGRRLRAVEQRQPLFCREGDRR